MVQTVPAEESDAPALDLARQRGRELAESFDQHLRQLEAQEREQRLAGMAWRPQRAGEDWEEEEDSLKVVHLEARLSELSAYVRAVDESLPWRAIQWGRRLVGRAW